MNIGLEEYKKMMNECYFSYSDGTILQAAETTKTT
jgi:hypothetical protein